MGVCVLGWARSPGQILPGSHPRPSWPPQAVGLTLPSLVLNG